MRLMRYSYEISHVPGKQFTTPDTLSRMPSKSDVMDADSTLMEDTNIYLSQIGKSFPASKNRLDNIRQELKKDPVCSQVMRFHEYGWSGM